MCALPAYRSRRRARRVPTPSRRARRAPRDRRSRPPLRAGGWSERHVPSCSSFLARRRVDAERLDVVPATFPELVNTVRRAKSSYECKIFRLLFRQFPGRASMEHMSEGANGRVTIREIAELAGVSIATVSRVVNGREDVSA